ncbi:MAG: diguanylate cyclase, partial [Bosea sp. (in: a-proteobacteria)]
MAYEQAGTFASGAVKGCLTLRRWLMAGLASSNERGFSALPVRLMKRVGMQPWSERDLSEYKLVVASLFSSPASIIQGAIAGVVTPWICWLATQNILFAELTGLMVVIALMRIAIMMLYRRYAHENDDFVATRRWDLAFLTGASIFSAALGFCCYAALVWTRDAGAHVTAVAVTIAFASGFVARNAGRPGFVMMQLLTASLPLAFGLFNAHDSDYHPIGYFAFLFIASNIGITLSVHRNLMALAAATKASARLTEALGQQNITLDAALNNMVHGLAMFDRSLGLQLCNMHHRDLFELPETLGVAGTPIAATVRHLIEHDVMRPDHVRELRQAMEQVFAKGKPVSFELNTTAGKIYAVSLSPADKGGILMLTEDATRRKETQARVEHMARFDELTGLANRFELGAMLEASCRKLKDGGTPFAVLYIDLDGFKQVNDTLGHDVGDQVLFETARRLRMAVRHGDLLARFGGDEFVLIHEDA